MYDESQLITKLNKVKHKKYKIIKIRVIKISNILNKYYLLNILIAV